MASGPPRSCSVTRQSRRALLLFGDDLVLNLVVDVLGQDLLRYDRFDLLLDHLEPIRKGRSLLFPGQGRCAAQGNNRKKN